MGGRVHRVDFFLGGWGCSVCGVRTANPLDLLGRRCRPEKEDLVGEMLSAGHKPGCAATKDGMLWFCHKCGRYGVARRESLRQRCQGVPWSHGKAVLDRLARGGHPVKAKGDVVVCRGWRAEAGGQRLRVW